MRNVELRKVPRTTWYEHVDVQFLANWPGYATNLKDVLWTVSRTEIKHSNKCKNEHGSYIKYAIKNI